MSSRKLLVTVAAGLIAFGAAAEGPMHRLDMGMLQYQAKCAACHGQDARGGGTMSDTLVKPAADLATLALRNGGSLPTVHMWQFIEGAPGAGAPEFRGGMPAWGEAFRVEARAGTEFGDRPDAYAQSQIDAVIAYLATVQLTRAP